MTRGLYLHENFPRPANPHGIVGDIGTMTEIFGVSRMTIASWLRAGAPAIERGNQGKPWVLSSVAIHRWHLEWITRPSSPGVLKLSEQRARKDSEMADHFALKNSAMREQFFPRDIVHLFINAMFDRVRSRVGELPDTVAPKLADCRTSKEFHLVLKDAVYAVLTDLSQNCAPEHG